MLDIKLKCLQNISAIIVGVVFIPALKTKYVHCLKRIYICLSYLTF